jgi:hypothetical protein
VDVRVLQVHRDDFLMALNAWRYFARRDKDQTELALRMFCQARSGDLGPAVGDLFLTLFVSRAVLPAAAPRI